MLVRVSVPATVANVGPGFDVIGLATGIHCIFEARPYIGKGCSGILSSSSFDLVVEANGVDGQEISTGPDNLVIRAMAAVANRLGSSLPALSIKINNYIPLTRGLGSSAAAVVGGVLLANEVLGRPLCMEELLDIAVGVEGHPDNVTPALFGGITVSVSSEGQTIFTRLPVPSGMNLAVAVPSFTLGTMDARRVLPEQIKLEDAVFNISRAALLVSAFTLNKPELLKVATQDRLHQPYRRNLVPGLESVFSAALDAGALGVVLAGAGPSVMALVSGNASGVASAMVEAFLAHGVHAEPISTSIEERGARIMKPGDLEQAKRLLVERQLGSVFVRDGEVIFEARGSGIKPVMEALVQAGDRLLGSSCADKIVGRSVAMLLRYSGVDQVFATVAASRAVRELQVSGVYVEAGEVAPMILNRSHNGPCPFEKMLDRIDDPAEAVRLLMQKTAP